MTTANTHHRNTKASKGQSTAKASVRAARKPAGASAGAKAGSRMVPSSGPAAEPAYEGIIGSYNPLKSKFPLCSRDEWLIVGPVVRAAVARLEGFEDRGLRPYLTGMTRLAVWAHREGLPMSIEVLLSHPMLEAHAAALSGSVGTFRSQLRRLAAANGVAVEATGLGFDRPGYSQPYTLDEVRALLRFASSHSNEHRRRQLTGCILLGAGCGFSRGDLRGVCNNDVHRHDGIRYVRTHDRCTPILAGFEDEFDAYLEWCGDGPFVGVRPGANITDRMAAWVGERAGVPRFSTDRLRTFFVVEHLRRGTPVMTLLAIAGFSRVDALEPYLAFVPAPHTPCGPGQAGAR